MLRYSFLLLLFLFSSCGARKVAVDKEEVVSKVDSTFSASKEEVKVIEKDVITISDIYEIELVPADSLKPMIVNGKEYFNVKIKKKKQRTEIKDNSKYQNKLVENKKVSVKKEDSSKKFKKNVDRRPVKWGFLFLAIALLIGIYIHQKLQK